ncbi:hypothetical protein LFM09_13140 [Lentzea alba]
MIRKIAAAVAAAAVLVLAFAPAASAGDAHTGAAAVSECGIPQALPDCEG